MTRSQALYLKWRPTTFNQVIGQDHVVQTIANAVGSDRTVHAYLFCGPRGTGKTTLARLLAKALNCTNSDPSQRPCCSCAHCVAIHEGGFLDLIEIDAASNNSVDDIRDLRDKIHFAPGQGRFKVYIVDEAHMLSGAAFNALLKTLEEPPPHAIFVLATTEVHKVPLTVTSRCQRHNFRFISISQIVECLEKIVVDEGMSVEPAVLQIVARQATGSLRDAISLLDQLVVSSEILVTVEHAREVLGTVSDMSVSELVQAMVAGQADRGLDLINSTFEDGSDPRQFARQMVDYLRGVLLCKLGNSHLVEASEDDHTSMEDHGQRVEMRVLLGALRAFDEAARDRRGGWMSQLPLELAYLSCLHPDIETNGELTAQQSSGLSEPKPKSHSPPNRERPMSKPDTSGTTSDLPPSGSSSSEEANPAEVAAVRGEEDSVTTVSELTSRWNEVIESSRTHHHSLPALLEWCQPLKITGQTVLVGVKQDFAMSRLENHQIQAGLEQVLADLNGHVMRVEFTRIDSQSNSDRVDVDEDGVVALGVDLGARARQR